MLKFIELTSTGGVRFSVNVSHIFSLVPISKGGCLLNVALAVPPLNDNPPHFVYKVKESYEAVLALIAS